MDRTRLSKFLGGREVPRREFAARIRRVLAEREGTPVQAEEVARTRALMYAAARARSPLQAREFELADARAALEEERARAAAELAGLRDELAVEQRRREAAESALAQLTESSRAQREELAAQREAALRRIGELEQHVEELSALLRLQDREALMLDELARATQVELSIREEAGTLAGTAQELYEMVVRLRDQDQTWQADHLIRQVATAAPMGTVTQLWTLFHTAGRSPDQDRLVNAAATLRDPVELFYSLDDRDPVDLFHSLDDPAFRQESWSRHLIAAIAEHAPLERVARFRRACTEHGKQTLLRSLSRAFIALRERPGRRTPAGATIQYREERRHAALYAPTRGERLAYYLGLREEP